MTRRFLWLDLLVMVFVAILWSRVSDVGVVEHAFPSIVVPFALGLVGLALWQRMSAGERVGFGTFQRLWPIAPYVMVIAASALWAVDPSRSLASAVELMKNVVIFWVLVELIATPRCLRLSCLALIAVAGALSVVSFYQQATATFTSDYAGFAQASIRQIVGTENQYRLSGPVGDPNYYALILVVIVPLALALLRTSLPAVVRIGVFGSVFLISGAVLLTYSRGGVVVLGLALLLSVRHASIAVALLAIGVWLAPPPVWDRLGTLLNPLGDDSVALRLGAQEVALQMFLDHPFLGVGADNYPVLYQDYSRDLEVPAVASQFFPHNLYLQVASETGAAGMVTFLPIVIGPLIGLERFRRSAQPGHSREIAVGVEIALVCYLVASLLLHASYPRYLWILLALAVAAARR